MVIGDKTREGIEDSLGMLMIFTVGVHVLRIIFPKMYAFSKSKDKLLKNVIVFEIVPYCMIFPKKKKKKKIVLEFGNLNSI